MSNDRVAHADAILTEAKKTLPAGGNRDTAIAGVIALQGIGRALLAIEERLASIDETLKAQGDRVSSPASADEPFEWESIEDYREITGIVPIDKALGYDAPEQLLPDYLQRRERRSGRDAVIADLTAIVDATPAGSPAHDGFAGWLKRYRAGATIDELKNG
ncbi:hypothetical protein C8N24_0673 [Solirubrobacter pauli]|uniref:Uncharacterized protein n=1 Tax=Solirubrobacter pauli TaxID=166793 RepID=A0A660L726_9ACTN|nr:hypothetical protein [Solirubrobacter pauli]RKQ90858.1 hypothetical protein C8N24_0673 [Solirubrobacter pauli]